MYKTPKWDKTKFNVPRKNLNEKKWKKKRGKKRKSHRFICNLHVPHPLTYSNTATFSKKKKNLHFKNRDDVVKYKKAVFIRYFIVRPLVEKKIRKKKKKSEKEYEKRQKKITRNKIFKRAQ